MTPTLSALWVSIVRTIVPIIVGGVLAWLAARGITPLDSEMHTNLTAVLTVALSGLYYVAVRLLEVYVAPRFGWLLGLAKQPVIYLGAARHSK